MKLTALCRQIVALRGNMFPMGNIVPLRIRPAGRKKRPRRSIDLPERGTDLPLVVMGSGGGRRRRGDVEPEWAWQAHRDDLSENDRAIVRGRRAAVKSAGMQG
jgi:hypothetical protein